MQSCGPLSFSFPPQEECQNYVRVLIVSGRKVFMCGTNAFSPVCSSRQVGHWEGQAKRGVRGWCLTQAHSLGEGDDKCTRVGGECMFMKY